VTAELAAALTSLFLEGRRRRKEEEEEEEEENSGERTPFYRAAFKGHLNIIKLWIASGQEMDLGMSGDDATDAIGAAKERLDTEVVTLLERFKSDAAKTRHAVRVELA